MIPLSEASARTRWKRATERRETGKKKGLWPFLDIVEWPRKDPTK